MLAVAIGLMGDPKLCIFDEPSLGLAPIVTQLIGGRLQSMRQLGLTVLLIEQNAKLAETVADDLHRFGGFDSISQYAARAAEKPGSAGKICERLSRAHLLATQSLRQTNADSFPVKVGHLPDRRARNLGRAPRRSISLLYQIR